MSEKLSDNSQSVGSWGEGFRPDIGNYEVLPGPVQMRSKNRPPRRMGELSTGGLGHIASQRIVDVFREFDPDHIRTHPIDWQFRDGEPPTWPYYLIYVTRMANAVDYANSRVLYHKDPGYPPDALSKGPARLMPGLEGLPYFNIYDQTRITRIFVSDAMKQRFDSLRPKLRYVEFLDPATDWVRF